MEDKHAVLLAAAILYSARVESYADESNGVTERSFPESGEVIEECVSDALLLLDCINLKLSLDPKA